MTDREDLYDAATEAYNDAAERQAARAPLGSRDTAPWRDGIRAVVDLVLDARPDLSDSEALRRAGDLLDADSRVCMVNGQYLREFAKRLEAEHQAAQEKAAAEAEREKLIEQAQSIVASFYPHRIQDAARALADAGLLSAPTTDGGEA